MSIDPELPGARERLSRSIEFWHKQFETYNRLRKETVVAHSGIPSLANTATGKGDAKPAWINALQMSLQAHVINLAYGDPQYCAVAELPIADHIAPRAEAWLNKWVKLINLGDTARRFALASGVGWGIIEVDNGLLPPGARVATGQQVGPMAEDVSQADFGFDGHAKKWDDVLFTYRLIDVPLDVVHNFRPFLEYNPDATLAVGEYLRSSGTQDGRIHSFGGQEYTAAAMARIIKVFFPGSNVWAYWALSTASFNDVAGEPLLITPFVGHHSGPHSVLSHLDIPDNLVPAATIEGGKNLHYLLNELMDKSAARASAAKINQVFETGADRDAEQLKKAKDGDWVPVSNISKVGMHATPGPDPGVTNFTHAAYTMFKEVAGNLDDTLGLSPTAGTATQSELIRSRTNARGAEARRRMNKCMELIGHKLLALAMSPPNDRMYVPIRQPMPGSRIFQEDRSWMPFHIMPHSRNSDHMNITISHGSMEYRSPEQRLAAIGQALGRIAQVAQIVQAGIPIDMEAYTEIEAKYNNLPELRDLAIGLLPQHLAAKDQSQQLRLQREGVGQYTRTNVSERNNGGSLAEAMTQGGGQFQQGGMQTNG